MIILMILLTHWLYSNIKPDSTVQLKVCLGWYDNIIYDDAGSNWEDKNDSMDKWIDVIYCLDEATEGFAPPNISNEEYNKLQAASATW